jgi:hypothetical protein
MKRIAAVLALALACSASPANSRCTVRPTWTARSDATANPSLTYNVDRAASCPGHFAKINSAPLIGTSYVDRSAGTGVAYCYQVTALPPPRDRQATCIHRGRGHRLDTVPRLTSQAKYPAIPATVTPCHAQAASPGLKTCESSRQSGAPTAAISGNLCGKKAAVRRDYAWRRLLCVWLSSGATVRKLL